MGSADYLKKAVAAGRLFARLSQREADGDELHADLVVWTDDRMVKTACWLALRFSDKPAHLISPNARPFLSRLTRRSPIETI